MCGHHEICDGWIGRRVNSRMNGRTSQFVCQWRIWHHVYLANPVRLWFFTQSPSNYYSGKRWSLRGADMMESFVKLLNCVSLKMWPEQRVGDFSDIFKFVLLKKFVLQISLNYDSDFLTNDKSALVQPSLSLVLGVKPLSKQWLMALLMDVMPPSLCKLSAAISSVLINQLIGFPITIIFVCKTHFVALQ